MNGTICLRCNFWVMGNHYNGQTVYFDTKMPVQQMGKLYAYARVSSQSQRLDRQIRNVLNYLGEDRVLTKLFKEKYTGTKLDRPEF